VKAKPSSIVLSQIISRFDFSRYIDVGMHIIYIKMHSKYYASRKTKTTNSLGWSNNLYP